MKLSKKESKVLRALTGIMDIDESRDTNIRLVEKHLNSNIKKTFKLIDESILPEIIYGIILNIRLMPKKLGLERSGRKYIQEELLGYTILKEVENFGSLKIEDIEIIGRNEMTQSEKNELAKAMFSSTDKVTNDSKVVKKEKTISSKVEDTEVVRKEKTIKGKVEDTEVVKKEKTIEGKVEDTVKTVNKVETVKDKKMTGEKVERTLEERKEFAKAFFESRSKGTTVKETEDSKPIGNKNVYVGDYVEDIFINEGQLSLYDEFMMRTNTFDLLDYEGQDNKNPMYDMSIEDMKRYYKKDDGSYQLIPEEMLNKKVEHNITAPLSKETDIVPASRLIVPENIHTNTNVEFNDGTFTLDSSNMMQLDTETARKLEIERLEEKVKEIELRILEEKVKEIEKKMRENPLPKNTEIEMDYPQVMGIPVDVKNTDIIDNDDDEDYSDLFLA